MLSVMCCTMCRLNETRPYSEIPDNEPTAITASPPYQATGLPTGQPTPRRRSVVTPTAYSAGMSTNASTNKRARRQVARRSRNGTTRTRSAPTSGSLLYSGRSRSSRTAIRSRPRL